MDQHAQHFASDGADPQDTDDLIVQWVILLVGLVPVAVTLVRGGTWGVQPSMGLLMLLFAAPALLSHYAERARRRWQHCGRKTSNGAEE